MKSIESTGKTVEEAVQAGLAKLNLELSDVTFEVIDTGSKGFFGLFGAKPVKVRITERDQEPDIDMTQILRPGASTRVPTMVDKQPRPAQPAREAKPTQPRTITPQTARAAVNASREAASQKTGMADGAAAVAALAKETRIQHHQQPASAPKADKPLAAKPAAPKPAAKSAPSAAVKPAVAKPAQPRPPKADAPRRAPRRHDDFERIRIPEGPLPDQDPATLSESARRAYEYLARLTQLMGVNVKIYVAENSTSMSISMMGDTLGILIGRRGDTLDALQYLVSLEVNKDRDDYLRVSLDTENYRAKREDSLTRLADRMASRAVKTGRKVVLEPMNPYERRVLHSTLQNHPYVQTHSEGDEPNRRVVITLRTDVALPEATESTAPERPVRAPRPAAKPHDRREGGKPFEPRTDKPRGPRPQRPFAPRPERAAQMPVKPAEAAAAPVVSNAVAAPLAHDIPSDPTDDTI